MERGFGVRRGVRGSQEEWKEGSLVVRIYCMRYDSLFNNYFKEKGYCDSECSDMTVLIQKLYSQLTGHKRHLNIEPL